MKLVIDGRWVRTDYHDGISRYTAGIVRGMIEAGHDCIVLICDEKQKNMLPAEAHCEMVTQPISWRELFIARRLNAMGADVIFSPLQVMGFWRRRYKLILTLQDIIYYRHPMPPSGLPWYVRTVWRLFHMAHWPQRWLLNRADHVATVSKTSKKFIQQYHLTDRDITVVYNAPSVQLPQYSDFERTKNIIYMGSFMPYKNVETLIRGMDRLPRDYTLHLLSKISPDRKRELEKLIAADVNVVFHNGVSDEGYVRLLASAFCLATATKEEGFGLPITEAQYVGTPVVCSNLEVCQEVGGDGALYFDADDDAIFAEKVCALESPEVRDICIERGKKQTAKFTWRASADVLWQTAQTLFARASNS